MFCTVNMYLLPLMDYLCGCFGASNISYEQTRIYSFLYINSLAFAKVLFLGILTCTPIDSLSTQYELHCGTNN